MRAKLEFRIDLVRGGRGEGRLAAVVKGQLLLEAVVKVGKLGVVSEHRNHEVVVLAVVNILVVY